MKREYESLFADMLTENEAYKKWQEKQTETASKPSMRLPSDEAILAFYLDHHSYAVLTTFPAIVRDLATKIVNGNLGKRTQQRSAAYFTLKGIAHLKIADDPITALNCFSVAISLDAANVVAHYHSAFIYSSQFKFEAACTNLVNFMRHASQTRDEKLFKGISSLSKVPQLATTVEEWADAHLRKNQLKDAELCYSLAKKITPDDNKQQYVGLCKKRGVLRLRLGADYWLDARFDFDMAIAKTEKTNVTLLTELHGLRGKTYHVRGEYENAIADYNVLLTDRRIDDETKAKFLSRRAACYENMNDAASAISDLQSYLALRPADEKTSMKLQSMQTEIARRQPPPVASQSSQHQRAEPPEKKEKPRKLELSIAPDLERKKSDSSVPVAYSQQQLLMPPPRRESSPASPLPLSPSSPSSPESRSSSAEPRSIHAWQSISPPH